MQEKKYTADFHLHSEFSDDSDTPMEEQIERGIALGLDAMCFTDHVDYGVKADHDDPNPRPRRDGREIVWNVDYPRYFEKLHRMKEIYKGRIDIGQGLEFGIQHHTVPQFEALYKRYQEEYDFILLSMHQVGDLEFYNGDYFAAHEGQLAANMAYYEEILAVMEKFPHYSILSHLDMLRRYDPDGPIAFSKVRDIIAAILEKAIKDGKGIEINTSSWHYGLDDTMPSRDVLKLYKDLGGTLLTMGSDAYSPKYLADHFEDARAILQDEIGFTQFATFEKMQPVFHKL